MRPTCVSFVLRGRSLVTALTRLKTPPRALVLVFGVGLALMLMRKTEALIGGWVGLADRARQ
jgi:hypothetical protein